MTDRTVEQRTSEILAQQLAQALYDGARSRALLEAERVAAQQAQAQPAQED